MYDDVGVRDVQVQPLPIPPPMQEDAVPSAWDDFVCVADSSDLTWLKNQLSGRFEVKTKLMGLKEGVEGRKNP